MKLLAFIVTLVAFRVNLGESARILGLFPVNIKSHSIMINAIQKELIARGHQVKYCIFNCILIDINLFLFYEILSWK